MGYIVVFVNGTYSSEIGPYSENEAREQIREAFPASTNGLEGITTHDEHTLEWKFLSQKEFQILKANMVEPIRI